MLSHFKHLRRVVITGMGCVTPIGIGRAAFWAGLQRGVSGVGRIESFDVSNSPVKIAAEVRDFELSRYVADPGRWINAGAT